MRYRRFGQYSSRKKLLPSPRRLTPAQVKTNLLRLRAARDRLRHLKINLPSQRKEREAKHSISAARIAAAEANVRRITENPASYQRTWGGLGKAMTTDAQRRIWEAERMISEMKNSEDYIPVYI